MKDKTDLGKQLVFDSLNSFATILIKKRGKDDKVHVTTIVDLLLSMKKNLNIKD
jgi:hypothetical protein